MRKDMAMTFEIRTMRSEESVAVAQLFHDVWHETQAKLQDPCKAAIRGYDFFKGRIDMPEVQTLIAIEDEIIIGLARWAPGHLHSLFIAQGQRGNRIGEKLCEAVVVANRSSGGGPLQLECVEGNLAAKRFYERQGWRLKDMTDSIDETPDGQIVVKHWVMVRP